jgi:hypothetical protein
MSIFRANQLELGNLDIPSFMPEIQRYFKHFFPTVRSLTLMEPIGTCREIIYFIGQFQHLEDLGFIEYTDGSCKRKPAGDMTLVPPFAPPLRGRLVWRRFRVAGLLKDMIHLFGGIRFRYMDIFDVEETRLLLEACARTLETMLLYAYDPHGERTYPKGMRFRVNGFTAKASPLDFDLSRNESLRTLKVPTMSIAGRRACAPNPALPGFLRTTVSTITSPVFSKVIALYRDYDFHGLTSSPCHAPNLYRKVTPFEREADAAWHRGLFKVFREMYTARTFRLMLCAEVWDRVGEYAVRELEHVVAAEKAAKRLDYLPSGPAVVCSPQGSMKRKGE